MILEFEGIKPKFGANVFIAPTAAVSGDVRLADLFIGIESIKLLFGRKISSLLRSQ